MKTLKKGDRVPEFQAMDQDNNPISLSDYKGRKLIVFFYPRANTEGCTAEACNLKDNYTILKEKGFALLGVSEDTPRKQSNFKKKYGLPFPLLADTEHAAIDAFGVWGPKKFMGKEYDGIHRMTFLLDENGIITGIIDTVNTSDHAEQILGMV